MPIGIKLSTFRIIVTFLIIFTIVMIGQIVLVVYQHSRYDIENYNCVHMSKDCEAFFEGLGIRTQVMHGERTDEDGSLDRHCWLKVSEWEFESTCLMFSKVSDKYRVMYVDEGWIE